MITKGVVFENLSWEAVSLHPGVYVATVDHQEGLVTTHAIKVSPKSSIGLHYHDRGRNWVETIYFVHGGNFQVLSATETINYNTKNPVYLRVNAGEKYGINNQADDDLLFLATMKPSFMGFEEIVDCRENQKINSQ